MTDMDIKILELIVETKGNYSGNDIGNILQGTMSVRFYCDNCPVDKRLRSMGKHCSDGAILRCETAIELLNERTAAIDPNELFPAIF